MCLFSDARPIQRREFLARSAALTATTGAGLARPDRPRVAGQTAVYDHNSHADMILGRLVEGYTLDGRGARHGISVANCLSPSNDTIRRVLIGCRRVSRRASSR
jgi:hypothetical protein